MTNPSNGSPSTPGTRRETSNATGMETKPAVIKELTDRARACEAMQAGAAVTNPSSARTPSAPAAVVGNDWDARAKALEQTTHKRTFGAYPTPAGTVEFRSAAQPAQPMQPQRLIDPAAKEPAAPLAAPAANAGAQPDRLKIGVASLIETQDGPARNGAYSNRAVIDAVYDRVAIRAAREAEARAALGAQATATGKSVTARDPAIEQRIAAGTLRARQARHTQAKEAKGMGEEIGDD